MNRPQTGSNLGVPQPLREEASQTNLNISVNKNKGDPDKDEEQALNDELVEEGNYVFSNISANLKFQMFNLL